MRVRFGRCTLDTSSRILLREGEAVHLTPKAFQLLLHLIEVRPRAVSKSELQDALWPATYVSEGNLATLVKEARIAIGDDARRPAWIRTVHGYGYAFSGPAETSEHAGRSIVVVPFQNVSGNRDLDYLADGIAQNITNAFSRLASFRVLSHGSALRSARAHVDPETVGRELGVETVVHGQLSAAKERITIQVHALDVSSGTQIWGNRFHCQPDEVLRIEEDVTAEIVDALRLRLSVADTSRLAHRYTSNPHAYDLYLRGRFQWNKRAENALRTAMDLFERAVVADPEYALPYCGIADVLITLGNRDLAPPRETFSRALTAASRALELVPDLAEAHASLGAIAEVHGWDWDEGARKYRRAIELSPSYATAYQWYALHLARRGQPAEAEVQMTKALDLDRLSIIVATNAALISYLARDGAAATERVERALEIEPQSAEVLLLRGSIREMTGDLDRAIDDYRIGVERSPQYVSGFGLLGHALARRGDRAEAEEILRQLDSRRQTQYVSAVAPALINLGLGRRDAFFDRMETAVTEKSGWLVYIKTDARLDPVRDDERFERLLERVGFTASAPAPPVAS